MNICNECKNALRLSDKRLICRVKPLKECRFPAYAASCKKLDEGLPTRFATLIKSQSNCSSKNKKCQGDKKKC